MRAGQLAGTIAIVSARDSLRGPARAQLSGTAVMLELARLLAGETQQHTVVLASISGTAGGAGALRLAGTLPQPVDAVIVLGDLAGTTVHQPLVVPWSDGQQVAPPALRNTVAGALRAQSGLSAATNGLWGQIIHLAFPLSPSGQAPFGSSGEPAVLLSLSGEHTPAAHAATSQGRIGALGRGVLESLSALDAGRAVARPSAYLLWSGKVVPRWAVSLLGLFLILPVLAAGIDASARARRRGHRVARSIVWVLAAAVPFGLAALVVALAREVGLIAVAPATPVTGGSVAMGAGGSATAVLVVLVVLAGLLWLRSALIGLAGAERVEPDTESQAPGPATALLLVMCVAALVVWYADPYAALLALPALHAWMWFAAPGPRLYKPAVVLMLLVGIALPVMAAIYYAAALSLGPVGLLWSWMLLLAGGAVGLGSVLAWSVLAGCAVSAAVLGLRQLRASAPEPAPVTVRGPVTYAGPGSLGGTKSALRR